jgi:hypothetical protein
MRGLVATLFTLAAALVLAEPRAAQSQAPTPLVNGTDDLAARKHMGPTGKPCITIVANARAQMIDTHLFNHIVLASNACGQAIKMKVCYYHSDRCVEMDVPPYSRKETTLGIMPSMRAFRFEAHEQFNILGPN